MGFPIEKCRRALIETKNVSLEVALDYLTTTDEEDPKRKSTKTVRGSWNCTACTMENPSANTECEVCHTPGPTP